MPASMTLSQAFAECIKIGAEPYSGTETSHRYRALEKSIQENFSELSRADVLQLIKFTAEERTRTYSLELLFGMIIRSLKAFPLELFESAMQVSHGELRRVEKQTPVLLDSIVVHVGLSRVLAWEFAGLKSDEVASRLQSAQALLFLTGCLNDPANRKPWMDEEILARVVDCFVSSSDYQLRMALIRDLPPLEPAKYHDPLISSIRPDSEPIIHAFAQAKLGLKATFSLQAPPAQPPNFSRSTLLRRLNHCVEFHYALPHFGLVCLDGRWNSEKWYNLDYAQQYIVMRELKKSPLLAETIRAVRA